MCRASRGACDIEEKCTGNSVECPNDQFQSAGHVCRKVKEFFFFNTRHCFHYFQTLLQADRHNPCDKDEVCNGSGTGTLELIEN